MSDTYHSHGVQLLERGHALQQQDNDSTTLNGLNSPGEQVGRQGLEILKDTHAVGVSENLLCLLVVGVPNVGDGNKELEGILLVDLTDATFDIPLDLGFALLAMTAEAELLLVAPEDRGAGGDLCLRQEPVQVHDLVFSLVADQDEEGAVLALDTILDERVDSTVDDLFDHAVCRSVSLYG